MSRRQKRKKKRNNRSCNRKAIKPELHIPEFSPTDLLGERANDTKLRLYHGTTEAVARNAIRNGLLPRNMHRNTSRWVGQGAASRSDCIYLSRCYAPFFSANCVDAMKAKYGIVEVELSEAEYSSLLPDEDFIEQADRGCAQSQNEISRKEIKQRTSYCRSHLEEWSSYWPHSLAWMGTVAHLGAIRPEYVSRVAVFDPRKNFLVAMMAASMQVNLGIHVQYKKSYNELSDWFFKQRVDSSLIMSCIEALQFNPRVSFIYKRLLPLSERAVRCHLSDKSGLEIVTSKR